MAGQAPRFLRKCTKAGLPINAVALTSCFGLLAFMNLAADGVTVFNWLYNISSITGLLTWASILLSYIRFHKGLAIQGIDRDTLPYKAPFQPYAS